MLIQLLLLYKFINPLSAGCWVYSTSPKAKPQVGETEKW